MGVFTMPSLGADMETGTLVEWMVEPGDTVSRGDVVAVVETQKGAIEIEIFEEGTVGELQAELGKELPVGAPLALILGKGEAAVAKSPELPLEASEPVVAPETALQAAEPGAAPAPASQAAEPDAAPEPDLPAAVAQTPAAIAPPPASAASPAARLRAQELGVDLTTITGTGPHGAIQLRDLDGMPEPKAAKKPAGSPLEEMRKAIAAAMSRSKRTIPHFYLTETIDAQPATDFLASLNANLPPAERILLGALFVRAVTKAAAIVKQLNGHYTDGAFRPAGTVNPGVAVALRGGGLVAPALINAEPLDLNQTMAGIRDLVSRARAGRLRSSEMTEGTITISSLGDHGAEAMSGVIFPPQVALVGLGTPRERPWIVGGKILPRTVVTLTVSADHRVSDGRQVARFIGAFSDFMQSPETL